MNEPELIDGEGEPEDPIDDEGQLGEVYVPPWQRRQQQPSQGTPEKPLTNDDAIPLLPGAKKKTEREAISIKVFKLDPPNHGYKGEIPIGSDEAYVASLHGDGTYNFEFINDRKITIRKREGVRISVGFTPDADKGARPASDSIEMTRMGHTRDAMTEARIDRVQREILAKTTELAQAHTALVMKTAEESSKREQSFFATMLESTRASSDRETSRMRESHTQDMERMREQHRQDMERERAFNERLAASSDPNNTIKLLQQGMNMGGGNDQDREPWERAIEHGVGGLKHLRDLAVLSRKRGGQRLGNRTRQLPKDSATPPVEGNRVPSNTEVPLTKTRELARDLAKLARICDRRGMDIRQVLQNAVTESDAPDNAPSSGEEAGTEGVGQGNP